MLTSIKGALRRAGVIDRQPFRGFLRDVSGVIHVGAHIGQERSLYEQYRLRVVWVEPIPELFTALKANIAPFPRQRAVQALVTDKDGETYQFHITSNDGASSSIYPLAMHKDIWPDVTATKAVEMTSLRLPTLLDREGIDSSGYDALVMDTQGSELLILKGAASLFGNFRYIKTEAADFAAYRDGCQLAEIEAWLSGFGYKEIARKTILRHPSGGGYYDVVYKRAR